MLDIIVVSYNTRSLLQSCLTSVSGLAGTLWVVDNASSDGSPDMVRQQFPAAHLIANSDNRGFAAANNQALRAMGFGTNGPGPLPEAVLLLNPDTVVCDDALGLMYRFLVETPHVGATGAALIYPDGSFQHSAFHFPDLLQVFFDFFPINYRLTESRLNGRYPKALYEQGKPFPIDHPLGAALMVRGAAIEAAGLMDERLFIYCEEIDWCLRLKQSGWRVFCVPQARIVHYAAQSTRQSRDRMYVALWRSRFQLFEKHYTHLFRRVARLIVAAGVRTEMRRDRAALGSGQMSQDEFAKRLAAHRQVMEL